MDSSFKIRLNLYNRYMQHSTTDKGHDTGITYLKGHGIRGFLRKTILMSRQVTRTYYQVIQPFSSAAVDLLS
jgi:hypothetical protein